MDTRKLSSLLLALLLAFSLCVPARAAAKNEYETIFLAAADALHAIGLFNGVGVNADGTPDYALDRVPTRSEAVTMLVRLLGKEEDAKTGAWDIPFTDVADWAKPYVGYAYANTLTMGTGPSTFGGDDPVTAAQYLTFLLRALGYSSETDFRWDNSWLLTDEIELTYGQYHENSGEFLRGDVVFTSYFALSKACKDSESTLADRLMDAGAFTIEEYLTSIEIALAAFDTEDTGEPQESEFEESNELRVETVHYEWEWLFWTWSYDLNIPLDAVEYYKELERDPYSILSGYTSYVSDPLDDAYLEALAQVFVNTAKKNDYGEDTAVDLAISFVQSLDYLPDDSSLAYDYPKYPLETLYDRGGDCEDTSILLVSLIREMGYGCCLVEFNDHMGVGVLGSDNISGRYFEKNGKKYFYVETTDEGWEIGEMPREYLYQTARIWPF